MVKFEGSRWFTPAVLVFYALVTLVLFHSFVFSDQMLFGSDTVQGGLFARSLIVNGHIPGWNPFIYGGMPYVDAFHGDIFYPVTMVLRELLPLHRAIGWGIVLHVFLAGAAMYWCARQFIESKYAAAIGGLAYMIAPVLVSLTMAGHDGKMYVIALFPLAFGCLENVFRFGRRIFYAGGLAVVIGAMVLSPHPQMTYFSLIALGAFGLWKLYANAYAWGFRLQSVGLAIGGVVFGLGIGAIQLYPALIYTQSDSPRSVEKSGWDWSTSWSMHGAEAMNLIVPEFSGVDIGGERYWGPNQFKINSEAVGVTVLFLALVGLFASYRRARWFFATMAALALVYALGATTPVFHVFYWLLPKVPMLRAPSMSMFLFSFFTVMLMMYALDAWFYQMLNWVRARRVILWTWTALTLLTLLIVMDSRRFMGLFDGKPDVIPDHDFITQVGAVLSFLSVTAVAWVMMFRKGEHRDPNRLKTVGFAFAVVVGFILIDGLRSDAKFISVTDPKPLTAPTQLSSTIIWNQGQLGLNRALDLTEPVSDALPIRGIPVPVGYHGNQTRWWNELLGGMELANIMNPTTFNLMGNRWLIGPEGMFASIKKEGKLNICGPTPLAYVGLYGGKELVRNDNAFPKAWLVNKYIVLDSMAIHNTTLMRDLRSIAILERDPDIPMPLERVRLKITYSGSAPVTESVDEVDTLMTDDSVYVTKYTPDEIIIRFNLSGQRLCIVNDAWYDAWAVHVARDGWTGMPTPVLRADGALRAFSLPKGHGTATMTYCNPRDLLGRVTTYISITLLVSLMCFGVAWRK